MASTLKIEKMDITKMEVDCIVNAANNQLQHGGGSLAWRCGAYQAGNTGSSPGGITN